MSLDIYTHFWHLTMFDKTYKHYFRKSDAQSKLSHNI